MGLSKKLREWRKRRQAEKQLELEYVGLMLELMNSELNEIRHRRRLNRFIRNRKHSGEYVR